MERDKFLDGKLGEWNDGMFLDFSTWPAFGLLWEWAQEQEWWRLFIEREGLIYGKGYICDETIIHPDRFANAVYEFLKERT